MEGRTGDRHKAVIVTRGDVAFPAFHGRRGRPRSCEPHRHRPVLRWRVAVDDLCLVPRRSEDVLRSLGAAGVLRSALLAFGQSRNLRLQSFDFFVFAAIAWIIIAVMVNNGPEQASSSAARWRLSDRGLPARAYVRNLPTYACIPCAPICCSSSSPASSRSRSLLGTKLIPGFGTPVSTLEMGRLGFYRAPSGFDHPFCSAPSAPPASASLVPLSRPPGALDAGRNHRHRHLPRPLLKAAATAS